MLKESENLTSTSLKTIMTITGWFNGLPIYGLDNSESYLCMLLSEDVLAKEWSGKEEDEAWENL